MKRMNCVEILLVADLGEVISVKQVLSEFWKDFQLSLITERTEAIRFFQGQGGLVQLPKPDLVIVDLDLFQKNDEEVLGKIIWHQSLDLIPIIVLKSPYANERLLQHFKLWANCLITKPFTFEEFTKEFGTLLITGLTTRGAQQ